SSRSSGCLRATSTGIAAVPTSGKTAARPGRIRIGAMTLEKESLRELREALDALDARFAALPPFESADDPRAVAGVLAEVAERLGDNYPYFHPLYAGQMLKPPHPVA